MVKNPPAMQKLQETQVQSLGREDPLEEEMAAHSNILAGESHRQRSLAGYSPQGCRRVGHDRSSLNETLCMHESLNFSSRV